jgi:hypothetical protein
LDDDDDDDDDDDEPAWPIWALGALFWGARYIHNNRVCFHIAPPPLRSRDILLEAVALECTRLIITMRILRTSYRTFVYSYKL